MKKTLFMLVAALVYCTTYSQITPGLSNDFEDGTTQGWSNGGSSPNPPTNETEGDNSYLQEISSGGAGPGSRMVVFNRESEWLGDYSVLLDITFDARVPTNEDLFIRVAIEGGSDETSISSTNAVTVPAQGDWDNYTLSLDPSAFTIIGGDNTIEETLADVTEIRIIHSIDPAFIGDSIDATLHLDNIFVSGLIGFEDKLATTFQMYPNPAVNTVQVSAEVEMERYSIYNLLGAKVAEGTIEATQKQIDVSALQSGNYLIEITAGDQTTTQKFLKR